MAWASAGWRQDWTLKDVQPILHAARRSGPGTIVHVQYPSLTNYGRRLMINLLPAVFRTAKRRCPMVVTMHGFHEHRLRWRMRRAADAVGQQRGGVRASARSGIGGAMGAAGFAAGGADPDRFERAGAAAGCRAARRVRGGIGHRLGRKSGGVLRRGAARQRTAHAVRRGASDAPARLAGQGAGDQHHRDASAWADHL